MDITVTLYAPDDFDRAVTNMDIWVINERIVAMQLQSNLGYGLTAFPCSDMFHGDIAIEFGISAIKCDVSKAMELIHGLVFEQFSVGFE